MCFGFCPAYRVTVYGNGEVIWEGDQYVAVPGVRLAVISQDQVRQLVAAFERTDYFALKDQYTEYMVTDSPSAVTHFQRGGKGKTVDHYHGDLNAPRKLTTLEAQIDEIVGTTQWIGQDR